MATKDTKAPTGLSIARDGMKFTVSWKKADSDYNDGQQVQYCTNVNKTWTSLSLERDASSRTATLTASNYYPSTNSLLKEVIFRVRGKRSASTSSGETTYYNWSAWTEKTFYVNPPLTPTVTATLQSNANVTRFTWDVENETTNPRPVVGVEYQTMLIKNCTVTNGPDLRWASTQNRWQAVTNQSASGYVNITEDNTELAGKSYTRWFRIRGRGPSGYSKWAYAKHVYATPHQAVIQETKASVKDGNTTVTVTWASAKDAAYPIDRSVVEYAFAEPAANMTCPSNPGWTEAAVVSDTKGTDTVRFVLSETLQPDECLWVRVVNYHDQREQPSAAALVKAGALETPSGLSFTTNTENNTATVTCTNNSSVPDSKLALIFRMRKVQYIVGILDVRGEGTASNIRVPEWETDLIGFSVYAFVGTYTSETVDGVTLYTITESMKSKRIGENAHLPTAPETVTAEPDPPEAIIRWTWDWVEANIAEISWSKNPNAWESTDEPEKYEITNRDITKWRVSGIEAGYDYYFRVRLGTSSEDDTVWGPYSDAVEMGVYTIPAKPVLQLSAAQVEQNGIFTASWDYYSADGCGQGEAEVIAVPEGASSASYLHYVVGRTSSGQAVNIIADEWEQGADRSILVRVTSEAGMVSDWSDPVTIHVPDELVCTISNESFQTVSVTDSSGVSRSVRSLTALPLTLTVTGAPEGGQTTVLIERDEEYKMLRPDGSALDGYEGEAVVVYRMDGAGAVTITKDNLIGRLDDGTKYVLRALVSGEKYISASAERHFEVHWSTRANIPQISLLEELDGAVKITPRATAASGATCDIYRLSADKPELIVQDGSFGVAYVDPYPTIGEQGGYRVVYKTANGDYITEASQPAWTDTMYGLDEMTNIINFAGEEIALEYNMDLSHAWSKSFTETKYLGGSIQGDWSNTVSRSVNISAATVVLDDQDKIDAMRRLAAYSGVCHVRTADGSSFAADVQVNETRSYKTGGRIAEFSLKITRVDNEALDGVKYTEWVS